MFNNLKREIEKDFDKNQNFNRIMKKTKSNKKSYWGHTLVVATTFVAIELVVLNSFVWNKDNLKATPEKTTISTASKENIKDLIKEKKWNEKEVYVDSQLTNLSPETTEIKMWEEIPIYQKYNRLEYLDNCYNSKQTKIHENELHQYIDIATLIGIDYNTNNSYSIKGQIYSIKNINKKCAVAVKYENDENYYVFVNPYYRPATLGEFIEDINLKEIISFGTITFKYLDENNEHQNIEFYDVNKNDILNMLLSDLKLENVYSDTEINKYYPEYFEKEISISIDIPLLGYKNIGITLTSKGYLLTNILETGKGFYIGNEKINEFLSYLIENYDGYKNIYIYNNQGEILETEKESNEEKIMTIKNEVNAVPQEYVPNNHNNISNSTKPYNPNN